MPLQQVANIAVEDGRTLVISPWEKTVVQAIEKAILKSDLGLTPMTAGTVIRIPMPPLTEERRRDITKVLRHDAENARVAVRNVRRDVMNDIKELLKEKLDLAGRRAPRRRRDAEAHRQARRGHRRAAGRQGKRGHAGLMAAATAKAAAPRRDHHGRQRPLGAARGLTRTAGHKAGLAPVRMCIEECAQRGIEALTLFAFSSENWRRPAAEVASLMGLFVEALDREIAELHAKNVRVRFIGDAAQPVGAPAGAHRRRPRSAPPATTA